jgi:hypothetical protein
MGIGKRRGRENWECAGGRGNVMGKRKRKWQEGREGRGRNN